jgi:hypothetical protein
MRTLATDCTEALVILASEGAEVPAWISDTFEWPEFN